MTRIEIAGRDFWRILKACANACDKSNFRSVLRYIELRADGTECVATSLDNFIMQQTSGLFDRKLPEVYTPLVEVLKRTPTREAEEPIEGQMRMEEFL